MSLCVCFQNNDELMIAADTAVTKDIDGELYRMPGHFNKIRFVGPFVIFMCGQTDVYLAIVNSFSKKNIKTIHSLQRVVRECVREFAERHPEVYYSLEATTRGVAVLAAEYTPEGVVTHMMNTEDDFTIHSFMESPESGRTFTGGCYADEAQKTVNELMERGLPADRIIEKVFEKHSGVEVGGNIMTVRLDRRGACFFPEKPIREKLKVQVYAHGSPFSGHLTGSLIRTSDSYPRAEMNDSNDVFAAYKDASNYIEMNANYAGSPALNVVQGGATRGQIYASGGQLSVAAAASLNLQSGGDVLLSPGTSGLVRTNWAKLYDSSAGKTLQAELNDKQGTADAWTAYGVSMAFDSASRNLKLYNRFGSLIAQVNIP